MLHVEHLSVSVGDREVLHEVNLTIAAGETHVLFGPNGSGKTSLLLALMGLPRYRITGGRILFQGVDITGMTPDERARRGIGLAYQRPPTVRGVSLWQLTEIAAAGRDGATVIDLAQRLRCAELLPRNVNDGFSGGEIKKAELLQLLAQRPALSLIDEPDAGVDLDNISLVVEAIKSLLDTPHPLGIRPASLIITHTGHILNYLRADAGHVLLGGTLVAQAGAQQLLDEIQRHGYGKCPICRSSLSV
jgi:Fe-S cluster assembly ATP-binding protein